MKNKKLLSILGVAALLLAGNFAKQEVEVVDAAAPTTVYFKPNSNWSQANAKFDAWTWGGSSADSWVDFSDADGDGIYEATLATGRTGMKIVRRGPTQTSHSWDGGQKWNETGDISIPTDGKNLWTQNANTWDGKGTWGTYTYKAPEYSLMGTMTDWTSGTSMSEKSGVYTLTVEDVPVGEQQFKLKSGDSWFGYSNFTVNGIEVTQGQNDDYDNCIFESEGGNYVFEYTLSSKILTVTHVSYAELNTELTNLLTTYYNEGVYTRNTTINLTQETMDEIITCFHAGNIVQNRTTYFTKEALWMSNEGDTVGKPWSYYGTNGDNMTGGRVANVGDVVDTVAKAGTTMEDHYTTLLDIISDTKYKWTKTGKVWSCTDNTVRQHFLDFTAPCFLGLDAEHAAYYTLSHVEVEQTNDGLELRLVCGSVDSGKFEANSNNVLSQAVITYAQ